MYLNKCYRYNKKFKKYKILYQYMKKVFLQEYDFDVFQRLYNYINNNIRYLL